MPGRVMSRCVALAAEFAEEVASSEFGERRLNHLLNFGLELVDALSHVALVCSRRGFQPQIIELGQDAVLARHPTIAEVLMLPF